jgi:hypothetical protein
MKLNLTPEKIEQIGRMPFPEAVKFSLSIIESAHETSIRKTDPMKMVRLRLNIAKKRNSVELMKMFYDILLSGEGHAVKGSKWKNQYSGKF